MYSTDYGTWKRGCLVRVNRREQTSEQLIGWHNSCLGYFFSFSVHISQSIGPFLILMLSAYTKNKNKSWHVCPRKWSTYPSVWLDIRCSNKNHKNQSLHYRFNCRAARRATSSCWGRRAPGPSGDRSACRAARRASSSPHFDQTSWRAAVLKSVNEKQSDYAYALSSECRSSGAMEVGVVLWTRWTRMYSQERTLKRHPTRHHQHLQLANETSSRSSSRSSCIME